MSLEELEQLEAELINLYLLTIFPTSWPEPHSENE